MRAYRILLRLYPASFREAYGDEMIAILQARLRGAPGLPAAVVVWIAALADVLVNAARVQADIVREDVRYAVRTLWRAPGFALTAVLLTALGIGATTAAFSLADHVLVRPLPFPSPNRLVRLWQDQSFRGYSRMELSPANYLDWQRESTSFDGMAAFTSVSSNLVGIGPPQRLDGVAATVNLFRVLGVHAALGRTLMASDADAEAPSALVLSDARWRGTFGSRADILGQVVVLNDRPHVIVGVMPPAFQFPGRDVDFWAPLRFTPSDLEDRGNVFLRVVARLAPGVSLEAARAELQVIAAALAREYPRENAQTGATVVTLRDEVSRQPRLLLGALAGAALCMLLIACTNLANLLLARALARRGELAMRAVLGAGLGRLVRQTLTESFVIVAAGGVLGAVLAWAAVPLIATLVPTSLPIAETPVLDLRMLAVASVVTLATGLLFGVAPARRVAHLSGSIGLAEGPRTGASRSTVRLRGMLVVSQVAVALVLLVAAGLLLRALWQVQTIDPGFQPDGVLTLRTALPLPKYEQTERRRQFYDRVRTEVTALPGVSSAAYTSFLPMVMRGGIWPVTLDGRPEDPASDQVASLRLVTPDFFRTLGIPIRHGRDIGEIDTAAAPAVAVVSDSFVRQFWPGENPLGRRLRVAFRERMVVGVAGDVRVRGLERESEPQIYLPSTQVPDGALPFYMPKDLVVRATAPPEALVAAIREIVRRADPEQPISDVQTLTAVVERETAPRRTQIAVLGLFAAVGVLLASVGIYGLLAWSVESRTREIGLRLALGARRQAIVTMILGQSARLAVAGLIIGALLAIMAGHAMQALLAGVSPADGWTLVTAVLLVAAMTAAGSLLPVLRAAQVDPATALKDV